MGSRPPTVTTLRYTGPAAFNAHPGDHRLSFSTSIGPAAELIVSGCDDGGVTVRPALALGVYARVQAHDGNAAVAAAACSCDGKWVVSGDSDGLLAVHRLRREPFEVGGEWNEPRQECRFGVLYGLLASVVLSGVLHDGVLFKRYVPVCVLRNGESKAHGCPSWTVL